MYIRSEIERVIKENHIERSRCFECSKITYSSIIKKIEQTFVLYGGNIHWSNMGHGFNRKLLCKTKDISEDRMWAARLPQILPEGEKFVYVLFEDTKNYQPKYWVYEMCIPELVCIIGEVYGLDDFYIVSKITKTKWWQILIALSDGRVIGTIGLILKEKNCTILKKLFVRK